MSFKLSKKSVDILHNLASIEPSMILIEGNEQSTANNTARIYATAKMPDSFEATFGMYNINDLLGRFRLFGEDFSLQYNENDKTVTVYDDFSSVTIHTSDINLITPPKVGISIGEDESDIVFQLTPDTLHKMNEFMNVNGTNVVSFTKRSHDPHIRIEGYDYDKLKESYLKRLEVEPVWFIRLDGNVNIENFSYYTKLNFKMFEDDYTVRIRQYLGERDSKSDHLNKNRVPAIQFDGEYLRYVTHYLRYSQNQESLKNV